MESEGGLFLNRLRMMRDSRWRLKQDAVDMAGLIGQAFELVDVPTQARFGVGLCLNSGG
jgi:hypothetical protein